MGDLIDFATREVIDRSVEAAPDDEGLSVFVVTDGKELAIQALQDGVALTYVAMKPGETTTFHALPGPLLVRALGEGFEAKYQELVVAPGDHPEVVLGDYE